MKRYYSIDGFCNEQFETLWDLKHHLSLYSPIDLRSAHGCYVYRYDIIDDEHAILDTSFCRRIDVSVCRYRNGHPYLKFHLTKV